MITFATHLGAVLRRLGGARCAACGSRDGPGGLCAGCAADIPWSRGPACPVCAAPSPSALPCGRCLATPPAFDAVLAAATYDHPVGAFVRRLKYAGDLSIARPLAAVLAEALRGRAEADVVVAVPLTATRLQERGYNQSLEVARLLPEPWPGRLRPWLERVRDTPAQASLGARERARNVSGAFRAGRHLEGLHVAVVDDVMTSGATLDAAARALKAVGAARVTGWVVARAVLEATGSPYPPGPVPPRVPS